MQLTFGEDRIALVTGAGRGIGRAIATQLAASGVTVVCVSRSENSCGGAAEAIREAGGKAHAYPVDMADKGAVADVAKRVLDEVGVVDILVNNAGVTRDTLLLRMKDEQWDEVIETNLSGAFHLTRALAHPMSRKRWGRIVNISSVVGLMGNAGQVNYAASKAGLIGLTKSVAKELASRGVTANVVAPGFIETDMTADMNPKAAEAITGMIPLKRLGQAEDIAAMAAFLCSEQSGYVTGQVFTVDGGLVM